MIKSHPFTTIFLSLMLFFMSLLYSNPLYIGSILLFMILAIVILDKKEVLLKALKYSIFNIVLILIINPLISQNGRTVIFRSGRIPILGNIKITLEAIAFGANMGIKLACIITVFIFYGVLTNSDDNFNFFSKYLNKLTLISSMTVNIIHRLSIEMKRVKEVMIMRGVDYKQKSVLKRIKSVYPMLKVVFISALEGSLDRAEALHSRAYGKTKRTNYYKLEMKKIDYILNVINTVLLFIFILSIIFQYGEYKFYPVLESFSYRNTLFLLFINFVFCLTLLFIWGCKKWKFLKYKI